MLRTPSWPRTSAWSSSRSAWRSPRAWSWRCGGSARAAAGPHDRARRRGAEAESRLTGLEPRGIEADEAELDLMRPSTVAAGRAEAHQLVAALWPYIEALAGVIVEYNHLAGPTAIFMALLAVHGEEDARRREALLAKGQAFDLMPVSVREPEVR